MGRSGLGSSICLREDDGGDTAALAIGTVGKQDLLDGSNALRKVLL